MPEPGEALNHALVKGAWPELSEDSEEFQRRKDLLTNRLGRIREVAQQVRPYADGAMDRYLHEHDNHALDDGKTLLFGVTDGKVGVLDIATGEEGKVLPPHLRPVLSLAISHDGKRAASGGGDGVIRVFDLPSFELLEEFENPYGPVWGLDFSADGKKLFHVGLDDQIHVWQISPRKPFEPVDVDFPRRFQVTNTDDPGELQFARKCSVCHTLTPDGGNRAGPTLYGVFGRKVGTLPGYPYSKALLDADFVWNEKTISDLFDHGPDVVTPGSKMPLQRLKTVEDRDALVAFLKRATDPNGPQTQSGGTAQ